MSKPTPRPASSRGNTPRPRKIAGQVPSTRRDDVDAPEVVEEVGAPAPVEVKKRAAKAPKVADKQAPESVTKTVGEPGVLARQKTTTYLLAALIVVALVLAVQAALLIIDKVTDDDAGSATDGPGQVTVPDGRPVIANELAVRDGVDSAAKAAQEIVSLDYNKYDEEVEKAADLMTAQYEDKYRVTIGDAKDKLLEQKTIIQANVVAQGVVKANRTKLQALVLLNQAVSRTVEGKPETVVTEFKVLVTMIHTDQGWLVDGLDTDEQQDKTN